jgi:sec-independent protein translocase protein TatA
MGLDNPLHIAFLLVLMLLVFGAKRLPEMGHSLGSGMRGFKDALSGETTAQTHDAEPVAIAVPVAVAVPAPVAAQAPLREATAQAADERVAV